MRTAFHIVCCFLITTSLAYLAIPPRMAFAEEARSAVPAPPSAPALDRDRVYWRCGLDRSARASRWIQVSDTQRGTSGSYASGAASWTGSMRQSWRSTYRPWFDDCCWGGSIGMLGWLPGMSGTLGAGPADIDVDISVGDLLENIGDIIENLEFGWQGAVSVRKGRWTLAGYVSGLKLGQSVPLTVGGAAADIEATVLQWQANLYYRVGMSKLSCSPCPTLLVYEPYVGVRGYSAEIDVKTPGPSIAPSADWVDPVVGARLTMDFRNRWALELEGDVGGFGAGSDLSWLLRVGAGWRFARKWYLRFGWMIVDTDYEDGTGLDRFKWDLHQSGPYVALDFAF